MAGNTEGNVFGLKPVLGSKSGKMTGGLDNVSAISILKRIQNSLGLGGYSFGFNNGFNVYNERGAKELYKIQTHIHSPEKSYGLAGTPSGETHRADRITLLPNPFQVASGNNTWGDWLQIVGSSDTPLNPDAVFYDFHEILIDAHQRNTNTHFIQMAGGEEADLPDKLAAEDFSEMGFVSGGGTSEVGPIIVQNFRVPSGTKCWVRSWAKGQISGTIDFYISLHEYLY